ncbi:hypothetical protein GCM10009555_012890 [Acrocarpospora macrocephala]|uniref:Polysaccharide chain length determinant N-terminal domain-containing protein n=2 Tax=Acrocarpospora macrocephala TaxID=150177 RepID=A0A5M3WP94_9ACTN|nr:hypothetical protein Amac_016930 [Acrocarpospora macrocephala]
MDFWKIILSLTARKLVGPPLVLLSLAVAAATFYFVPVHYTSNVLMVLTTSAKGVSTDPTKPAGLTNPLLQFTDGLKTTASIMIQSMNAPDIRRSLGAPVGGPVDLVIDDGRTNPDLLDLSGPYIFISVDAPTAEQAKSVVDKTQALIRSQLDTRQKGLGAPRSTFITVAEVVPVSVPELQLGGKWQGAIAAFVLTLAGTFGLAYAVVRSRLPKRPTVRTVARPTRADPVVVPGGFADMDDVTSTMQWRADQVIRKAHPPMITSGSVTRVEEEPRPVVRNDPVHVDNDDYTVVVVVSDAASDGDEAGVGGRAAQNGNSPDDHRPS